MYCLVPEKPLRLVPQGHFLRGVYGTFYLAIGDIFYEFIISGTAEKCEVIFGVYAYLREPLGTFIK